MNGSGGPGPRSRNAAFEQAQAIDRAFSEPLRLVDILTRADTYDDAADALSREFQISVDAARVVMENQVKLFTRQGTDERHRQFETIARTLADGTEPTT